MKNGYKKLKKGISSTWKGTKKAYGKTKESYTKSKPMRKKIIKRAKVVRSNIDNYFDDSMKEMRKIAGNYKF